jgi:hypothetical protein
LDHLDLLEAASDAAAALDDDGLLLAPYLAAFGVVNPDDLDPADRTDIYLEIARSMAARYADVVEAVNSLEGYEADTRS